MLAEIVEFIFNIFAIIVKFMNWLDRRANPRTKKRDEDIVASDNPADD